MSFSIGTGLFNVQGSLNALFLNNINTSLPKWANGNFTVQFDAPNQPLRFPSFSIIHTQIREDGRFEGDRADGHKGRAMAGVMEIKCWVDSTSNPDYPSQLRQMADMVTSLWLNNQSISILDYYSSTVSPAATGYIVRLRELPKELPAAPHPNPAVKQLRVQFTYFWVERYT